MARVLGTPENLWPCLDALQELSDLHYLTSNAPPNDQGYTHFPAGDHTHFALQISF